MHLSYTRTLAVLAASQSLLGANALSVPSVALQSRNAFRGVGGGIWQIYEAVKDYLKDKNAYVCVANRNVRTVCINKDLGSGRARQVQPLDRDHGRLPMQDFCGLHR